MERQCALVPKPRKHLVTYHGVLAPASGLRSLVVPRREDGEEEAEADVGCRHGSGGGVAGDAAVAVAAAGAGADAEANENAEVAAFQRRQVERRLRERLRVPHGGGKRRGGRRRHPWAELLRRVFGIEVLVCPRCSGIRRVLAAIHDPDAARRVLGALGLSAAVPALPACRAPPGRGAGGEGGGEGSVG